MKISSINNTNFNGYIKMTPTAQKLLDSAELSTKSKFEHISNAMKLKNDSLAFTFANSRNKRNGQDFFHISLIEENTTEAGYSVARKVVEIPGKYRDSLQACSDNKNLLEKFIPFFESKYKDEIKDSMLDFEKINEIYNKK